MSKRLAPKTNFALGSIPLAGRTLYGRFDGLNGEHPWQEVMPEGFVGYPVRELGKGKVIYFNFALAREMGLIPPDHADELTSALEKKLIETFSIQIVNEYDQAHPSRSRDKNVKPQKFMATRYLQIQHANKRGSTSGDGRGVWNGTIQNAGTTWDVSSRGTGVTCLAPGSVEASRPLKTGAREFGYGCGLADVSELLGSAILSEIFHLKGVGTERVLTVIDLGKGNGIGVRAAPNLIRPAHLFLYLKQRRLEPLRRAVDFLIERQCKNGEWSIAVNRADRYRQMLSEISISFARFASRLERDYIFLWMEWDGDNVLANGGIIDYGSIRQFGLRHDQYRYDDVERFSTNLNQQRSKARTMVQVFAQMVNYLETGRRRALGEFAKHAAVRSFDSEYDRHSRELFLLQLGFKETQIEQAMTELKSQVDALYSAFSVLERTKVKAGIRELPDGFNRPAAYNMRSALREMPSWLARETKDWGKPFDAYSCEDILHLITSSYAKSPDLRLRGQLKRSIERFVQSYHNLLRSTCGTGHREAFLRSLIQHAEERNTIDRITGNGAEFVVDEVLKAWRRGLSQNEIQTAIDLFIASQTPACARRRTRLVSMQSNAGKLFQEMAGIASEFSEDI